jgi:putative spermidine/putrescine transport system permease protein
MSETQTNGPVLAADGMPLKQSLNRALRRQKLRALLLIAPLLLFVVVTFVLPIADMLFRSVENELVSDTLPLTVAALDQWDPAREDLPGEEVFAALARDLQAAVASKTHTRVGSRLNYEKTGMASLFRRSGRQVARWDVEADAPFKDKFIQLHKGWGGREVWETIRTFSASYTDGYFLNAVDLKKTPTGIEAREEEQRIYITLFKRTMVMSLSITLMCLLIGYPVAFLLASLPMRSANLLMILVLLPFWTSLLVRTSAWKVLLQQQGVINDVLVAVGLVGDLDRLQLINNQFGTITAMTHILAPFMILPLYSVMKTIPITYVRAAKSLGATDWTAFWRVYFPQSIPGIGAGSILVFILAIGYYITPEIVGGNTGTFISNRIAYHISSSLNWGLGAALGTLLLAAVMMLYYVYDKIVGIDNVKLG